MKSRRSSIKKNRNVRSAALLIAGGFLVTPSSAQNPNDRNGFHGAHFGPEFRPAFSNVADTTAPNAAAVSRQNLVVESQDVVGRLGQPIPLKVSIEQTTDITVKSINVLGLPPGFVLKNADRMIQSTDKDEILDLTGWDVTDLRIDQAGERAERFRISLGVIWESKLNSSIEVNVTDFQVTIEAARVAGDGGVPDTKTRAPTSDGSLARSIAKSAAANPNVVKSGVAPMPGGIADIERKRVGIGGPGASDTRASVPRPAATSPQASPEKAPPEKVPQDTGSFVERAKSLIARGDISGARLFLERARVRNEPNATFLLAQTWDPEVLRRWNVRGLRPDPDRARALYAEAAEQGRVDDPLLSAARR